MIFGGEGLTALTRWEPAASAPPLEGGGETCGGVLCPGSTQRLQDRPTLTQVCPEPTRGPGLELPPSVPPPPAPPYLGAAAVKANLLAWASRAQPPGIVRP